jgi:hypothetical protein
MLFTGSQGEHCIVATLRETAFSGLHGFFAEKLDAVP